MANQFQPFGGHAENSSLSSFWETQGSPGSPVVLDGYRHRQVDPGPGRMPQLGQSASLGALNATLSALREADVGGLLGKPGVYGGVSPQQRARDAQVSHGGQMHLRDVNSSQGFSQVPLDVNANAVLSPQRTVAELSARRKEAIKAAFRRIDVQGGGWVTVQAAAVGLQNLGNLPGSERDRVIHGLCGGGGMGGRLGADMNSRITFNMFAGYYQSLGCTIERDRDFEDLLRHHWGFAEVSDILDDMKNKFAMVGLAYAFRRNLEQGGGSSPELSIEAFQNAISHVGMRYSDQDVRRLFEAFGPAARAAYGDPPTLEVMRLTQHLTSAPRPSTPIGSLPGAAHISEVQSQAGSINGGDPHQLLNLSHGSGQFSSMHYQSISPLSSHKDHYPSQTGTGCAEQKFGPMAVAPPEMGKAPEQHDISDVVHAMPPVAPPEDTHDSHDYQEMTKAPAERDIYGKLPITQDTQQAPPEDDDGTMMPEETDHYDPREPNEAPRELDTGLSGHGYGHGYNHYQHSSLPQHHSLHGHYHAGGMYDHPGHHSYHSSYDHHAGGMYSHHHQAHGMYNDFQNHGSPGPSSMSNSHASGFGMSQPIHHAHGGGVQFQFVGGPNPNHPSPQPQHQPFVGNPNPSNPQPQPPPPSWAGASTISAPQSPSRPSASIQKPDTQKLHIRGQRRAVTVGCNYIGTQYQLSGCINDSDTFISLLTEDFGYSVADIRQLRDDHPQRMPTRKNITAALNWLVKGAKEGDHLFFHYSGHGSQRQDTDGDEVDGKDETIVPCDYQNAGMLADDDLRKILVEPLCKGVRLTVIMDCCHSGTGLDLAIKVKLNQDDSISLQKKSAGRLPKPSEADVVSLSGCMDSQTSADVTGGGQKAAGAMTTSFKKVISEDLHASYHSLLAKMRAYLKKNGFAQVPQMCSEQQLNMMEHFLPEADPPGVIPAPVPTRPPQRRALTVGINYLSLMPGRGRLSGCINDSETVIGVLKEIFRFNDQDICRLRDDRANMMPTKANIISSIRWLTQGAGPGDELFFHYSGHGGQQKDTSGDEESGKDDTMIPCDFQTAGQIADDELYNLLVEGLPQGCRMWVLMDCCHSGSALDLPFTVSMDKDGRTLTVKKSRSRYRGPTGRALSKPCEAEVIMISGCQDDQTSADVSQGPLAAKPAGAMTTAFRHCINATINVQDLLMQMRAFLKRNGFGQVPQLSSDLYIQLDCAFANYQTASRTKTPTTGFVHQQMSREIQMPPPASPMSPMRASPISPMRSQYSVPTSPLIQPMVAGSEYAVNSRINRLEEQIQQLRRSQSPQRSPGNW
eukprot:TRINITY_DN10417_c1_g1_i1.p1 TRINITY_DN10417_c1_g1~~TRINITY_DN10417_c1_g1_i1.p1  ORF type:complete len:1316 (-),score=234.34 TRINITY_DN10417_c1_g1_i1:112-4023(-)